MFGITSDGSANVLRDQRGVVKNVSIPKSVRMKKHDVINDNELRGTVAVKTMRVAKERGHTDVSDTLSKIARLIQENTVGSFAEIYFVNDDCGLESYSRNEEDVE